MPYHRSSSDCRCQLILSLFSDRYSHIANNHCSKVSRNGVSLSSTVRAISLSGCSRLTDRGLALVARRCHLLQVCFLLQEQLDNPDQELEIQACPLVTNGGLLDLTSRCHHLNHLDVQVKYKLLSPSSTVSRRVRWCPRLV